MRGINGFDKRKELFFSLRNKGEIICIQETHSTTDCENEWTKQWGGGEVFYAHGSSRSKGVMTMIKFGSGITTKEWHADNSGRFLILQVSVNEVDFVIVNVYAPNEDNPEFFRQLLAESEKYSGYRIVTGDFNLALNPELDRNTRTINNPKATAYVNEYIESNSLIDIWRVRNPTRKFFSWRRMKPVKLESRIDLMIIDQGIAQWVSKIEMKQSFRTDHLLVFCNIDINMIKRGAGIWKFNSNHLRNPFFVKTLNEKIKKQIDIAVRAEFSPSQLWEHIKLTIIYNAQDLSRKIAFENNMIQSQLEERLDRYGEQEFLTEGDEILRDRTKRDLDQLVSLKAQGAIFRSKATWFNEGEHPTKYFLSLEKSRAGGKIFQSY